MKRKHSVGFFSAYYRGLECLVDMWPQIREKVPDATLHIAYGWQSWVAAEGEDEFYVRMNKKLEAVKDQGVTVHDRLNHEDLAKLMSEIEVWAYPTQFPEIFCITAVKANAAGMKPVITNVAALKDTGGPNATYINTRTIYSDEYKQKKFIEAVVEALNNPQTEEDRQNQRLWAEQYSWSNIAKQWREVINAGQ